MDRCDVGFGLGVASGVIALYESSVYFAYFVFSVPVVEYLVAWYFVATGLPLLVLWASFMVYKGREVLGGIVMFATSLALPVNHALFMIPGIIRVLYFPTLPASGWLLFSMIGSILV